MKGGLSKKITLRIKELQGYEPFGGLEPPTCSLRMSCSTN